jgi:alcohol dehydrogenase class IV
VGALFAHRSSNFFTPRGALPQISEAIRCHDELGDDFDCIVAIGGGRIIDTGKAISLGRSGLSNFINDLSSSLNSDAKIPVVALPTITGSGSEVTPFAVTYQDGLKYSISHPSVAPAIALIDPQIMRTVSPLQQAISAVDAVSHGIEALLSNEATEESSNYAKQAVALGVGGSFRPRQ